MTGDPSIFLHSFAQAIAVMALYPSGHPSRERTIDGAYQALAALPVGSVRSFTFLDGEVIYGREPLREFKDWDWGDRLAAVGIQRLESKIIGLEPQHFKNFVQPPT